MPIVSVIVPVYNCEKYLAQCLDSVINQTLKDIEIICVNDASTDNSFKILADYVKRDCRIKLINFENNKGVSAARNSALDIANGEYIYFLDSDDWIENDYLDVMVKTINKTNSQIVMNRNMFSFANGELLPYNFQKGQYNISDNSYIDIEKDTHNVFFGVCSKLYASNLIKEYNIKFPEGYVYEDNYFHYITFAYAEKIYFFNGSPYYYRETENSITSTHKSDSDKIINVLSLIYDYYKEHKFLDRNIKIYYTMPLYSINDEKTYTAFKKYFTKAGNYILNNDIYTDIDKYFCKNILSTENYNEYISKFPKNVAISYIRRNSEVSV